MSLFKTLLGDSITEDQAKQLDEMLAVKIQETVDVKQQELDTVLAEKAEIQDKLTKYEEFSKTQYEAVQKELEDAKKSIQENAEFVELKEQYNTILESQAALVEKHDTELKALKEGVDSYIEYAKEEINKDSATKIEEAINTFKQEHTEQFTKLEEASKANHTIKLVIDALQVQGYQLSEDEAFKSLQNEIVEQRNTIDELNKSINENAEFLFTQKKENMFIAKTATLSEMSKDKVKSLVDLLEAKDIEQYERLLNIVIERNTKTTDVGTDNDNTDTGNQNTNENNNTAPSLTNLNENKQPSITDASCTSSTKEFSEALASKLI